MTETRVEISEELIRDLLREQQPDLADRPLKLGARGWDNQLWRLGDDLAVRLPGPLRACQLLSQRSLRQRAASLNVAPVFQSSSYALRRIVRPHGQC